MQTASGTLARRVIGPLAAQALVWISLSVAFAALLRLAGPQSWPNALQFAALNWLPWAILAPAVFWYSGRFPLERHAWWRSIPAHVLGCAACVAITVAIATYGGRWSEPLPPRIEDRRAYFDREGAELAAGFAGVADENASPAGAAPARLMQPAPRPARVGSRGDRSLPPNRRPGWWPFLGTTLLRANFDAAVYLIVVAAAHALAFYRRAQERERHAVALAAGLNRAKLDALRLQLQPHFLFNTLNAISTLVHRDAVAADELIGDLSELLRLSLQTTAHEVPLARELELLDCYVAIEQARLGSRLRIVREIDPAAVAAYVPTFVLQPLVENAIRHGIEPRLAPGTVAIRAHRDGDLLRLSVADDGLGVLPKTTSSGPRRGIGVSNTQARLRALHGDAARFELATPAGGGTEVLIQLPFRTIATFGSPEGDATGIAPATTARDASGPGRIAVSPLPGERPAS